MRRALSIATPLGIALLLLLGTAGARAASGALVAGPLFHLDGQTITCQVVNATTRPVENVLVRFRDESGAIIAGGSCESIDSFAACGFTINDITGTGRLSCEITADRGTRGLRATLQNLDVGAASDAR